MRTLTQNWIPFVSLFLILLLVVAAGEPSHGLSVHVAYQDKDCGDGRTVVARVLENGKVRLFGWPRDEDLGRGDFANRLRVIYSTRSERTLFLMADSNLPFQNVAEIIDTAETVADRVAIVTPRVESGPCLSVHLPRGFYDLNYGNHREVPVKMKPVPLGPWR
jgi:biopolymer transport protein ExbD